MLRYLLSQRCSKELAEDLVQEASVRALSKLEHLRDPKMLKPWFKQIVRHVLMDEYKRQARFQAIDQVPEPSVLDATEQLEGCDCVLTMLNDIPNQYARLLTAIDIEEDSVQDVAKKMGIQANNASVRLYRARKALRGQLKKVCGTLSPLDCLDCSC